jgi:hypothetical protein
LILGSVLAGGLSLVLNGITLGLSPLPPSLPPSLPAYSSCLGSFNAAVTGLQRTADPWPPPSRTVVFPSGLPWLVLVLSSLFIYMRDWSFVDFLGPALRCLEMFGFDCF